jgi:protein ImuB
MGELAERGLAMSMLHLRLALDHADAHHEYLEPAASTLDVLQVVDLVRLRLEHLSLPAGVEELEVSIEGIRADPAQLRLFSTRQRRDLDAAARALARLRAAFGERSVTRARLRSAHLPEASFCWDATSVLAFPSPPSQDDDPPPLIRRVLPRPMLLPPRPRHDQEAWLGHHGAIERTFGPYCISGGWWVRTVERDYYYVETQRGDILWIYYDRPRRRWFLHGMVD